jgi:fatty acid desaturase
MNENEKSSLEDLLERAEDYGKTTLELFKLKAVDKTSDAVSTIVSRVLAIFLLLMFLLIGSFALSFWLGDVLGKVWYGFLLVALFYGLLGIMLFFVLHNGFKKTIANTIIKQMLK